jgi:hypothetical protein
MYTCNMVGDVGGIGHDLPKLCPHKAYILLAHDHATHVLIVRAHIVLMLPEDTEGVRCC